MQYSVFGTMIFGDYAFGPDGFAIVRIDSERWIAVTVAVKSCSATSAGSTQALRVPAVLMNCGTASLSNGYKVRPSESALDKNQVPVAFGAPLKRPEGAADVVARLLADPRVVGFLRLQVTLPRCGSTAESAFKHVASPGV